MKEKQIFPQIVNVTDLRYRWSKVGEELEKGNGPIVVLEHSTPKALIYPFDQIQKTFSERKKRSTKKDPLIKWREKYADQFSDWDATAVIRKQRNSRWNLS